MLTRFGMTGVITNMVDLSPLFDWTEFSADLNVVDGGGVFSAYDVQVGDVYYADSSTFEAGTITLYEITAIASVADSNNLTVTLVYSTRNDNAGPPDVTFFVGTVGVVTRTTPLKKLTFAPATSLLGVPDFINAAIKNSEDLQILDNLSGGGVEFVANFAALPAIGKPTTLYCTLNDKYLYRYSTTFGSVTGFTMTNGGAGYVDGLYAGVEATPVSVASGSTSSLSLAVLVAGGTITGSALVSGGDTLSVGDTFQVDPGTGVPAPNSQFVVDTITPYIRIGESPTYYAEVAPPSPQLGDLWLDSTANALKIFTVDSKIGFRWRELTNDSLKVVNPVTSLGNIPATSKEDLLYHNTNTGVTYRTASPASIGSAHAYNVTTPGTGGLVDGTYLNVKALNTTVANPLATDLYFSISVSGGAITPIEILAGGTNYTVGDVVTIDLADIGGGGVAPVMAITEISGEVPIARRYQVFSSTKAPTNPIVGDHWFDLTNKALYEWVHDIPAPHWVDVTAAALSVYGSASAFPAPGLNPSSKQFYYARDTNTLYRFDGNIGQVTSIALTHGGSGYVNGTYEAELLNATGLSTGQNFIANVTVSGGVVTSVTIPPSLNTSRGFAVGDVLRFSTSRIGNPADFAYVTVTGIGPYVPTDRLSFTSYDPPAGSLGDFWRNPATAKNYYFGVGNAYTPQWIELSGADQPSIPLFNLNQLYDTGDLFRVGNSVFMAFQSTTSGAVSFVADVAAGRPYVWVGGAEYLYSMAAPGPVPVGMPVIVIPDGTPSGTFGLPANNGTGFTVSFVRMDKDPTRQYLVQEASTARAWPIPVSFENRKSISFTDVENLGDTGTWAVAYHSGGPVEGADETNIISTSNFVISRALANSTIPIDTSGGPLTNISLNVADWKPGDFVRFTDLKSTWALNPAQIVARMYGVNGETLSLNLNKGTVTLVCVGPAQGFIVG